MIRALLFIGLLSAMIPDKRPADPRGIVYLDRNHSEGWLLGATSGKAWVEQDNAAKKIGVSRKYRVYTATGYIGDFAGSLPRPGEDPPDEWQHYVKMQGLPGRHGELIAVQGSWNAQPRKARLLANDQPVYEEILRKVVAAHGIKTRRPRILQHVQVDLDGDGQAEVLLNARGGLTDPPSPRAGAGDYSLILLRQVVGGVVRNIELDGEFNSKPDPPDGTRSSAPSIHRIIGCFDVDGDGRMEIVVEYKYYEGSGITVYALSGGRIERVLTAGVGV
jgi:hypothetical protein